MLTPSLKRVSCISEGLRIGLENYADMAIYDKEQRLIALRFGGYPEAVQAMSGTVVLIGLKSRGMGYKKPSTSTTRLRVEALG